MHRPPIGDDQALEAPLILQQIDQQRIAFRTEDAVDAVVRTHDGPRLGIFHRGLESGQVDLPQGALVHLRGDAETLIFLVVGGEMLEGCAHTLALNPVDPRRGHLAREIGVFGEILEVAATQGRALHVVAGAKQHIHAQGHTLLAQGHAHLAQQLHIPGGGQTGRRGEGRGREALAAMSLRSAIRRTPWGPSETSMRGMPRRSTRGWSTTSRR